MLIGKRRPADLVFGGVMAALVLGMIIAYLVRSPGSSFGDAVSPFFGAVILTQALYIMHLLGRVRTVEGDDPEAGFPAPRDEDRIS